MIKQTVEARGKVIVLGVGKSGHVGGKIAATLTSTGSPAVVLDSLNALHGDLGVVADGDVVLALSYSGETEELLRILPAIARFQVGVIAMCGAAKSTLAQNCDVFLDVNVEQEACPLNLAPTSSTTVMLALGDALAMVLLEARGFQKEDFAKFHPAGMIGRSLLLRVHQIMRPRSALALVRPTANIRAVLEAMTAVRAGAAVVAGEDEQLLGIFTHGDFVRHFQTDPRVGERLVADLMTLNPVIVHQDKLAVEVLNSARTPSHRRSRGGRRSRRAGRNRRFAGSDEIETALVGWLAQYSCALPSEARDSRWRRLQMSANPMRERPVCSVKDDRRSA